MELKQYAIVLVNLDSRVGSEINKTRPCVVISPNEMNKPLNTIVVAPLTTSPKKCPSRISVLHNNKRGMIAIDQIRTVDKKRIVKSFKTLTNSEIQKCKDIIREAFVD